MYTAAIDRLIHLGETINTRGIPAADVELLLLAHDARDLGVEPVIVDIMVDDDAPAVVRERAFGLVAARMAASLSVASIPPAPDAEHAVSAPALSFPVGAGR